MSDRDLTPDFTLPSGNVVLVGDTRPPDWLEFFLEHSRHMPGRVFSEMAKEDAVAIIHCGDIAVYGAAQRFWQGWAGFDRDFAPLLPRLSSVFPVAGNHEYRGFTRSPLRHYFTRFPHLGGRRWYSVRVGAHLYVLLDSNFSRLSASDNEEQDRWHAEVLDEADRDSTIDCVFTVLHHPPYTNISRRYLVFGAQRAASSWAPRWSQHRKVTAIFAGHVHTYEHLRVDGKSYFVTGGGGSPRFHLKPKAHHLREDRCELPGTMRPFHYLRIRSAESSPGAVMEMVGLEASGFRVQDRATLLPDSTLV